MSNVVHYEENTVPFGIQTISCVLEEKEGCDSYPFPPLELTEDPLEALVHVVELGRDDKHTLLE